MSSQASGHTQTAPESLKTQRFLRACAREPVDATPVWMMRQAGRSLPAYRELRSRYGFLDLTGKPDLMAQITLMPLDVMEVDAAIMFADIMLPLASLGIGFEIREGGPVVDEPIRSMEQIRGLPRIAVKEAVPAVMEAISLVRGELNGRVPLIGFSGAPLTLACYLVDGRPSREFSETRSFMFREPHAWDELMTRLTDMVVEYLTEQAAAGVQAVQLFDSWVGGLGPSDMERFVLPYTRRIFDAIAHLGLPRINFGTNTHGFLELMAAPDCEVVGVDWRVPLDEAWRRIGPDRGIQGNLDPAVLFGPPDLIKARVKDVMDRAGGRPGHIFNLGHGVLPGTPLDSLKLMVDEVHAS